MDRTEWVDILRTGTFIDMKGQRATFAEADLDRMVQNFGEGKRRVPLVFGHPKTDDPAYGWAAALRRVGDVLQAAFKQVPEMVKNLIAAGRYKNVSVAVYPDGTLRHVGLLGAAQPAVDGLREVRLEDGVGFTALELSAGSDFARPQLLEAELAEFREKLDKALDDLQSEREERERRELEFADREVARQTAEREDRFCKLIEGAKVMPGERKMIMALAENLGKSDGGFLFSEGGKEERIDLEELFFRFLESRPSHRLFEVHCPSDRPPAAGCQRVEPLRNI